MKKVAQVVSLLFTASLILQAGSMAQTPVTDGHWVSVWGASPYTPIQFPGMPPKPAITNKTIRMIVCPTAGGQRFRVRFSNAFGSQPLVIGAASVGANEETSKLKAGTVHALTFGGRASVSIPPGAPAVSDPVDMAILPFESLAVSIYLPLSTPVSTWHELAKHESYLAGPGDQTSEPELQDSERNHAWYFLSSIEAWNSEATTATVAFGDSITDGDGDRSRPSANWPDQLAARVNAGRTGAGIAIVNEGISGNRVLHDGAGVSALTRFDQDVLAQPGVANLIVMEGINDIGFPRVRFSELKNMPAPRENPFASQKVSSEEIIAGLRQIIARAHEHGIRVFGVTLTPFEGTISYDAEGEAIRQAVNHWIRTTDAYDGIFDMDALVRDPEHPTRLQKAFDSGDHIHPNPAGYKAMADSIPLSSLRRD
jgi:lysophospholipase L1-like esterase